MRRYIVLAVLCLTFFIFPLHIFIIGNNLGIGVQGAVYRYQVTEYGTSFILLTREIGYVLNGTYSERTAISVLIWILGTASITLTTIFAGLHVHDTTDNYFRQIAFGLIVSCLLYLISCITQYGFFFHGPGGISLPFGIILILCWIMILNYYQRSNEKMQNIS